MDRIVLVWGDAEGRGKVLHPFSYVVSWLHLYW